MRHAMIVENLQQLYTDFSMLTMLCSKIRSLLEIAGFFSGIYKTQSLEFLRASSARTRSGLEEGRKLLQEGVAADRCALEVYTKADLPQEWAPTQNNLGTALKELGIRSDAEEGRKLLQEGVAADRLALEVRTRADLPQDWAETQSNLGDALQALGMLSTGGEGRRLLEDAVAAYRSALEVRSKADLPRDWAETENNLGTPLKELGTGSRGNENPPPDLSIASSRRPGARCEEAQGVADKIGDGIQKSDRDELIFMQKNLAAFDKAGLIAPDISRMKQALGT